MNRTAEITIGSRLRYAGQDWTVARHPASSIVLRNTDGFELTTTWQAILQSPDYAVAGQADPTVDAYQTSFNTLPERYQQEARALEAHVAEVATGRAPTTQDTEPEALPLVRPEYDVSFTTLAQRITTKVRELAAENSELKMSERTLKRLLAAYRKQGVYGLVDQRHLRLKTPPHEEHQEVMRAIEAVAKLRTQLSDISLKGLRNQTIKHLAGRGLLVRLPEEETTKIDHAEPQEDALEDDSDDTADDTPVLELKTDGPKRTIDMPSQKTFNRLVGLVAPTLVLQAKQRESILANLKKRPFGRIHALRPGQYMLIDINTIDILALSEVDGSEIRLRLALALDLYSRAIVSWDLIESDAKSIDISTLVLGILFPKLHNPAWPEGSKFRYTGIPQHIVLNAFDLDAGVTLAGAPALLPEILVVDGGRAFKSRQLDRLADEFQFDFIFARPYKGSDKSQIERLFRTIRQRLMEDLRGYVGQNVRHRGKKARAYHFRSELLTKIGEYITEEYNNHTHDSLYAPDAPKFKLTPNQMLDLGLQMQGLFAVPRSRNEYYLSLRPVKCAIGERGVTIDYRQYDGPEFNPYRGKKSPYPRLNGRWPVLVDDRDPTFVFFQDPYPDPGEEGQYFAMQWLDAEHYVRPFETDLTGQAMQAVQERTEDALAGNKVEMDRVRRDRNDRYAEELASLDRSGRGKLVEALQTMNNKTEHGKLDRKVRNAISRQGDAQRQRAERLGGDAPSLNADPSPTSDQQAPYQPLEVTEVQVPGRVRTLDFNAPFAFPLDDDVEDE